MVEGGTKAHACGYVADSVLELYHYWPVSDPELQRTFNSRQPLMALGFWPAPALHWLHLLQGLGSTLALHWPHQAQTSGLL